MVAGLRFTPGCVPVPERFTTCDVGVALSVNVIVAVRLPVAAGSNVAATTQLEPAITVPTVRQSVPTDGVT